MCLTTQRTVGVRALCGEGETYKWYLDDLNGITYQNYAKVAVASKTATSLFAKAIEEAIKTTITDILYSTASPIQFGAISKVYYHNQFTDTIQPVFAGDRGLTVSINNVSQIAYSSSYVRTIYVKVATDTPSLIVNVTDNNGVIVFTHELLNVVAGLEYTIEANVKVSTKVFTITFDQTTIETYQAQFNNQYQCCGKVTNYLNGFDYLLNKSQGRYRVTGGFGVSADIDLACDEDKLLCTLLPYFGEEIRFKAGVYLANEVLVSDRLELFVMNNKEDILQLAQEWNKDYQEKLKRRVPHILNSLKGTDSCCFKVMGISKGIQLV